MYELDDAPGMVIAATFIGSALETLPKISAAMARGELSYSKVRALTRVACSATEDYFLSIALHGTADYVERLVRGYKRAKDAEELSREAQQQRKRYFSYRYAEDGSLVFHGRLPAEAGALLLKALQGAVDELPKAKPEDVSAETRTVNSEIQVRRADALVKVAESYVASGPAALSGGDRHLVHVHVSAETLRDKEAGCCEFEDGPSMAAETARRLACDASVVAVIENDKGEPLQRRAQDAHDLRSLASLPECKRSRLPLPGVHPQALRRSPHRALGERRRNQALQPRLTLLVPPPHGA